MDALAGSNGTTSSGLATEERCMGTDGEPTVSAKWGCAWAGKRYDERGQGGGPPVRPERPADPERRRIRRLDDALRRSGQLD